MTTCTKKSLEHINQVSRQLLSRILSVKISLEPKKDEEIENTEILLSNKALTNLVSKRQTLVTNLFTYSTADDISSHSALLQEMLALDRELINKAVIRKQEIAEQALKLKKNKKVAKSYQKY